MLLILRSSASGTLAAIVVSTDGSLTYKTAATGSDKKLYLNSGQIYARLSSVGGDKILTLSSGNITAT